MSTLTNKERVQAVASALLAKSQKKSSAKSHTCPKRARGEKVLYCADNGPFVRGDEDECIALFRPSMPCYFNTRTPQNKKDCDRGLAEY